MNLVRYRPLQSRMLDVDRMLDSFFGDRVWNMDLPAVDVREKEDHYHLEMDLAGRTEKDLSVNVENGLLTISSEQDEKKEEKQNGYLMRERRTSSFSRCFKLPEGVDAEKIDAAFHNGVLELRIPKNPATQPKRIEVKAK